VPEELSDVERDDHHVVDQAIAELGSARFSPDPGAMRPAAAAAVSAAIPVLIAFPMVVRANQPGKSQRRAGARQG
jgi:hypothetical protein